MCLPSSRRMRGQRQSGVRSDVRMCLLWNWTRISTAGLPAYASEHTVGIQLYGASKPEWTAFMSCCALCVHTFTSNSAIVKTHAERSGCQVSLQNDFFSLFAVCRKTTIVNATSKMKMHVNLSEHGIKI